MELLDRLEKALEGLIERFTDGVFRTPVQPVEIGKRLVREMDAHRTVAPSSTFVPNLFVIIVSADTFAKFSMLCPPLLTEFETLLKQHVADQGYKTVGPIAVRLQEDESLKAHEVKITPVSMKTPPPMNAVLDAELAKQGTVLDPLRAGDDLDKTAVAGAERTDGPTEKTEGAGTGEKTVVLPLLPDDMATQLLTLAPSLEVVEGHEAGLTIRLRHGLRIGRGPKNDIPLTDNAVSRDHLEFIQEGDAWIVRDLDSVNKTKVNGEVTASAPINPGDEILIGRTKLVVRGE